MIAFILGLICGFAIAIALASYEDGEPFLSISRAVRMRLSQAIDRLPGLYQQGAEQAGQFAQQAGEIADQARQAYRERAARRAARPRRPAIMTPAVRVCSNCGNQVTRQGAGFCGKCGATLSADVMPHPGMATAFGALQEAFNLWLANPGLLLVPAQAVLVVFGWLLLVVLVFGGSLLSAGANLYGYGSPGALSMIGLFTPWSLLTYLVVIPYAYAGVAGGVIRALDGTPDFRGFFDDGLRYLPRSYLALIAHIVIGIVASLIFLVIAAVAGVLFAGALSGMPAINAPQQAAAGILGYFLIVLLVSGCLLVIFAPYWVMTTAAAFQDGYDGISLGIRVAGAHRWPLLGIVLVLLVISILFSMVVNILLAGCGKMASSHGFSLFR